MVFGRGGGAFEKISYNCSKEKSVDMYFLCG